MSATEQELLMRQEQPQRYIDVLLGRIATLEARLVEEAQRGLRNGQARIEAEQRAEALREYTDHRWGCRMKMGGDRCTCGLAALTAPQPQPAGVEVVVAVALSCPNCGEQHLDEGEWETRPHRTHLCLFCGYQWRVTVRGAAQTVESGLAERKAALLDDIVKSGHLPPSSEVYDRYDALVAREASQ